MIDGPRGEDLIDASTRARSVALRMRFAVNSWPTVFLADAEGRPCARTKDHRAGALAAWLEQLRALQASRLCVPAASS